MNLLLRLPNWLGDIVMALPAARAVRARWPEAQLSLALPKGFAPLMTLVPGVDRVVPLEARGWRDRAALDADVAALRSGGYDVALLFTNSYASARMARLAGIGERWGYRSDFRSSLLTRGVPKPRGRRGADRHHSRYYGRLVEALGAEVRGYDVRLPVPEDWRASAETLLLGSGVQADAAVVGFAPGAAYGTAKQWPPARVAEVVARCVREAGVTCLLVGTIGDAEAGTAVLAALQGRVRAGAVVNLIGRTDLPTLSGLMARCRAFVCNDSGAMHLASALGVPTVAPFGATDEVATAPLGPHRILTGRAWCRPCLRRECPLDHRCMTTIPSDDVFRAVAEHVHA